MVLLNHGLFTFGATSREAYERHVELLETAEAWLNEHAPAPDGRAAAASRGLARRARRAPPGGLARSRPTARPATSHRCRRAPVRRATRPRVARGAEDRSRRITSSGRSRRPLVGRDVAAFADSYSAYFAKHAPHARTRADDARSGASRDPRRRARHDHGGVVRTRGAGRRRHLPPHDPRSRAGRGSPRRLRRAVRRSGCSRSSTGSSSRRSCDARANRRRSPGRSRSSPEPPPGSGAPAPRRCSRAASPSPASTSLPMSRRCFAGPAWKGIVADVTDADAVHAALSRDRRGVRRRRHRGRRGGRLRAERADRRARATTTWRSVLSVNVDSVARLLRDLHPLLARSPVGGRVVVIGSKNVAAPGRGAAAYSASKAALTQLSRVAALEWAADGIRVNVVHPDAVFDTGLWTPELLAERARRVRRRRRDVQAPESAAHRDHVGGRRACGRRALRRHLPGDDGRPDPDRRRQRTRRLTRRAEQSEAVGPTEWRV